MKDKLLLDIASNAIEESFLSATLVHKKKLLATHPTLSKKGAVFVTLTQNGELRGCIGSLVATRSLLDDLVHHAKNAAFRDPRFLPLTHEEFETIEIELSILSEPENLPYKDIEDLKAKIEPNIHGVILQHQGKSATFLPQVWEQLPDFDTFFSHLCQKAGLGQECLEQHPEILTYKARKIKK